ncbi:MAG: helix-turn-helix domain-containing protein [Oscillospiraceae bacterium]|nr:helix-turn-helix domain-containing protein [Oscillospiraceae bacterium]
MDILPKLFSLMEQKNINASTLSKEIGISSGLISQWKKGFQKPSLDVVTKIADYFNVSVDYLLSRTDNPQINK